MATLDPPFDRLNLGSHELEASLFGWQHAGTCQVSVNSQFEFSASGSYKILGHSGNFQLDLALTDRNPGPSNGPCSITFAGNTLVGTYTRNGSAMSFSDGTHDVTAAPDPQGVILQIAGYPKIRIRA